MSDKTYDILNKIQRWLMAVAALYSGLSAIWGFPYPDEVYKTFGQISGFMAAILEISTVVYHKKQSQYIDISAELEDDETEEVEGGVG